MKTLYINFSKGEYYKIPLEIVASLIANKEFEEKLQGNLDAYSDRIDELQENEDLIFELIRDIPWDVLKEYAVRVKGPNLSNEWESGEADLIIGEK